MRICSLTVGPVWRGGQEGEEQLLENAYWNSLQAAVNHGIRTIAFPSISTGSMGTPRFFKYSVFFCILRM